MALVFRLMVNGKGVYSGDYYGVTHSTPGEEHSLEYGRPSWEVDPTIPTNAPSYLSFGEYLFGFATVQQYMNWFPKPEHREYLASRNIELVVLEVNKMFASDYQCVFRPRDMVKTVTKLKPTDIREALEIEIGGSDGTLLRGSAREGTSNLSVGDQG